MKQIFEKDFRGRKLVVEIGELAKQANSAVLVRYGDTVVLSTITAGKEPSKMDFFPLMVVYNEKQYSVGKIPGGFIKREGRPTENATLTARLIDRPIRPLFEDGFRHEVQIVNTVLSVDQDNAPEMTALFASSLALALSELPWSGPIASVVVGRVNDEYIINPTVSELEQSDINLIVAGTSDAINMVEAGAKEVTEEDMLKAIIFGQEAIKELVSFEEEIIKELGKEKIEIELLRIEEDLDQQIRELATNRMIEAIQIKDKLERAEQVALVKSEVKEQYLEQISEEENFDNKKKQVKMILDNIEKDEVRRLITIDKVRPDGRKIDELRPLESSIDLLPRTHGSALFTRGQTQSLSVTTLGALGEHQILDGLTAEDDKRFILHYNFPPFSVGETGRYGAPGRREVGHGALGERALLQVIPNEEDFPYTIRVVSEILESNGSSSQASICAGCMSLMAAGVPIKDMVAGIAMGLISDGTNYTILTDIQGMEDHLGDMDFKVAGTKSGICALQMDIKIDGITNQILEEALTQAKKARLEVLENMKTAITEPRKELSQYAPKIKQLQIDPEKIKDVIGRGGETITKIIQESSNVISVNDNNAVKIDIEDDGRVIIYHTDYAIIDKAMEMIKNLTREVETDKIYQVKVLNVEDFGCFVEMWPGCEGLVHVSQLDTKRVEKPSDVVKTGDVITVKSLGYDKRGRLNLSRKEVLKETEVKTEAPKEVE